MSGAETDKENPECIRRSACFVKAALPFFYFAAGKVPGQNRKENKQIISKYSNLV